jgi:hypothetical protein
MKPNLAADLRMLYPSCCWILHIIICSGELKSIGVSGTLAEFTGLSWSTTSAFEGHETVEYTFNCRCQT